MQGIKDKVVVITGASSESIRERAAGKGGNVKLRTWLARGGAVVLGARGLDRLEALTRRIAGAGGEVSHARTDVRRRGH